MVSNVVALMRACGPSWHKRVDGLATKLQCQRPDQMSWSLEFMNLLYSLCPISFMRPYKKKDSESCMFIVQQILLPHDLNDSKRFYMNSNDFS